VAADEYVESGRRVAISDTEKIRELHLLSVREAEQS
jgi:hypothetical protein